MIKYDTPFFMILLTLEV